MEGSEIIGKNGRIRDYRKKWKDQRLLEKLNDQRLLEKMEGSEITGKNGRIKCKRADRVEKWKDQRLQE